MSAIKLAHTIHRCTVEKAPTLFLVHGLTSAGPTFGNITEALGQKVNVVLVDLRGHGKTAEPADLFDYSLSAMANDLRALQEELRLPKAHWLGHSWGSRVVLTFAEQFPELVSSVVVEDEYIVATPETDPNEDRQALVRRCEELKGRWKETFPTFEEAFTFLEEAHGKDRVDYTRKIISVGEEESDKKFIALFKPHVAAAWDYYCRHADMSNVWMHSEKYTFPIHVIKAGGESSDIDEAMFKTLEAQCAEMKANRTVSVIPEAGHTLHRTHPEEFCNDMFHFFSRYGFCS